MRVLDLFSGIGGFSLGLERAGMKTVAFCEIDPFCRKVLAKHWPGVPIYDDVRELTGAKLAADGIAVDVICGGFPCQDISTAGNIAGMDGARSGLWSEYARLIGELRPRYAIVENVANLLSVGLGRVLGDLAEIGFDAEWHCISAADVGAPHIRDRLWIVAYPNGQGQHDGSINAKVARVSAHIADAAREHGKRYRQCQAGQREPADSDWWEVEPAMGRVADGVPNRMAQLRALGNAVVPQIPELIGRAICEIEQST